MKDRGKIVNEGKKVGENVDEDWSEEEGAWEKESKAGIKKGKEMKWNVNVYGGTIFLYKLLYIIIL
jgi:hypothetical protein